MGFVNIQYVVLPDYRRQGYGKKIIKELTNYLMKNYSIKCIEADIDKNNIGSIKTVLSVGYQNGEVTNYSIVMNGYVITKGSKTVKGNTAVDQPNEVIGGPTMDKATSTDTHKGIIYLDPTDLTKTCNVENSVSTTEIKTGCMKWYVFNDEGDNYTMILDHNTTARIKWNDDNKNVSYEESNLYVVVEDLKTTSGWKVSPRLITADEVNAITGKTDFNASNGGSWYYFDTKTQIHGIFNDTTRSEYDWLYNNLNLCKTDSTDHGCTVEDNNTYTVTGAVESGSTWGYWTSTTVGEAALDHLFGMCLGTAIWASTMLSTSATVCVQLFPSQNLLFCKYKKRNQKRFLFLKLIWY